ncbi:MAG: pyrroline-5-carboxylate reductase [Fibrobacteria bacterium]|nr:pyrroline-5-carboxylate reductase [Fibrobacteria bacterium]
MSLFPLVLIGCGNMGAALVRGLRRIHPEGEIRLVDPDQSKTSLLESEGVGRPASLEEALEGAAVVVLAIKPQLLSTVGASLHGKMGEQTLVVSIMAGVDRKRLRDALGSPRVARTMPNLPLMVGAGATAIATDGLSASELGLCRTLMATVGSVVEVLESQIDAVTGLSGSGPAYVLRFLQALEDGGVLAGLARPVSRELAMATIEGTLSMVRQTGLEPEVLRGQVTSPGGTTIHGLKALEDRAFPAAVMEAVAAATRRSKELGA